MGPDDLFECQEAELGGFMATATEGHGGINGQHNATGREGLLLSSLSRRNDDEASTGKNGIAVGGLLYSDWGEVYINVGSVIWKGVADGFRQSCVVEVGAETDRCFFNASGAEVPEQGT